MDEKFKNLLIWLMTSIENKNYLGVKEVLKGIIKEIEAEEGEKRDNCS